MGSSMESATKRGDIKLPKAKDLEAFAGQGTLIVDPKTGEVRVGSKSEADAILGNKAGNWTMITAQVENTLQNSYQSALNYVSPEGGVHPQGGYVARSGNYYPPAPALMDSKGSTKAPEIFKKT